MIRRRRSLPWPVQMTAVCWLVIVVVVGFLPSLAVWAAVALGYALGGHTGYRRGRRDGRYEIAVGVLRGQIAQLEAIEPQLYEAFEPGHEARLAYHDACASLRDKLELAERAH